MQDEEMLLALYSLSPGRRLTSILLLLSPFLSPASCSCRRPLLSKPNRNSFSRWTSRARCSAAMRSRPSPRSSCWPRTGSGTRCRRIPSLTRCVPCAVRRTVASRVCFYEHWKFDETHLHLVARCSKLCRTFWTFKAFFACTCMYACVYSCIAPIQASVSFRLAVVYSRHENFPREIAAPLLYRSVEARRLSRKTSRLIHTPYIATASVDTAVLTPFFLLGPKYLRNTTFFFRLPALACSLLFFFLQQVKDGIAKIQAHKRRFAIRKGKHRRDSSFGSTTFTDGESDSEDESEFCGSGEWAEQGVS